MNNWQTIPEFGIDWRLIELSLVNGLQIRATNLHGNQGLIYWDHHHQIVVGETAFSICENKPNALEFLKALLRLSSHL